MCIRDRHIPFVSRLVLTFVLSLAFAAQASEPMQGVPPSRDSQVTFQNYRVQPFSRWAFSNMGAPAHVVMIPRAGDIHTFGRSSITGWDSTEFDRVFADNYADGVVVIRGDDILHERYFHDFGPHDQHIWFSMTKLSSVSS